LIVSAPGFFVSSLNTIAERFAKIREMRDSLCKQEKTWREAFAARDWMVSQVQVLQEMCCNPDVSKDEIKERIEDIMCVLSPDETNGASNE
tara:strand:- start:371 stop:643 length:273 start_codon:yes stop_codon:yes gene_type:complete